MTHSDDVVEKVAVAIFESDDLGLAWTEIDQDMPVLTSVYRERARAALDAIDALYADEVTV